jgi:PAS domain S-box-containing protein
MRVVFNQAGSPWIAYGLGAAAGGMATLLQWLIHPLVGSHVPFLFFLVALVAAVLSLGRGPAIVVLIAGTINGALMSQPVGSLVIQRPHDIAAVILFFVVGAVIIAAYGNRLQLTTARAALSERRLALAQKNSSVGIFELDFEAQTAFVSPSLCHMLGVEVTQGDVRLDQWLAGLRPDHVDESRRVMQEHIARGELRYEREQRIELPNGGIRWLLNRVELEATTAGVLTVARGVAVDITERKRIDELLQSTEKRFSVALESSAVPFSILEPVRDPLGKVIDFRWTYLNPAAAQALGHRVHELIGRGIGTVLPRAWDAPGLFERYVGVIERNEQSEFEVPTMATNQGMRWYNVVAAPLQGSVAVWFANITARKQHEQDLQDADKRKDEFLATLAHELRNPLAPIRQSVRVTAASNSTEAQRRWSYAIIERQVQHMSLLLDDLLDISRVGRGTLLLRKSKELLSAVMDIAIETARPHMEAKRHHLEKSLPQAPVVLDIDPVRVAQVIGNLLTNAAKYTDPGGRIHLSAEHDEGGLAIYVKDNGIGLSREQQSHVFEMFSQVPAAMERSQGGLGIGLALARGLIELHGGTIVASSAGLGQGTEFKIRLPESCIATERDIDPAESNAGPAAVNSPVRLRVLIADDNVDAADSLAELLRLEGYDVYVAYDGAEAIATSARVEPDVALLDVGMPRASGLEVVRAIRQQPRGQHATLIAVTGWGQEKDRQVALEAGFDHHLTKPMLPEDIFGLIQRGSAARRA